jgi:ATP-dependent Lon protease
MTNNDVVDFIEYLNTNQASNSKKRSLSNIRYEDIIADLKLSAIDRLRTLNDDTLKYKSNELRNYCKNLREIFKEVINGLKNDKTVKNQLPDFIRLGMIAELSVCRNILEKIIDNSLTNPSTTFEKTMQEIKNSIESKYKKRKLNDVFMIDVQSNNETKKNDDYEDDSDVDDSDEDWEDDTEEKDDSNDSDYKDSSDSGNNSDSDSTDDEKKPLRKTKEDKNEIKTFMNQIFKSRDEESEEEILKYYKKLPDNKRKEALAHLQDINKYQSGEKPVVFQIMDLPLPLGQKNHILKSYTTLATSRHPENKLKTWFDSLMTIPFGKFKGINLDSIQPKKVKTFLDNLEKTMNSAVYGHEEAKRQIIQVMGQQIRNPKAKGNVIGIYGPPGNGKCFAYDTPILMYDGTFKKVQDVVIGDQVMGDDSNPRNVLSLGRGEDDMYEIIPSVGESYTVNSEHILCLQSFELDKIVHKPKLGTFEVHHFDKKHFVIHKFNFENYDDAKEHLSELLSNEKDNIIEITVNDYLKLPYNIKNKLKGYRTGVDFSTQTTTIEPYEYGNCIITQSYESISNEYKYNDRQTRLKLLAGIIDTYGSFDFTVDSNSLLNDIVYLTRSLGFVIERNHNNIKIYGNNINELPLRNNIKYLDYQVKNPLAYDIQVKLVEFGKYYGFTLDGNNRFLLGDFTVTHNTSLIKEGIAKAMDKPFVFISLGGATDGSFLDGHSYTYEGSIYGRIMNGLINSKCMDPVIYFDELDKISKTHKGDEITNILVHLTDPVQNCHFRDKYFHGIDIDLSRATIIFSFNDPSNVNPILLDRITCIETKYLLTTQKTHIASNYLLPEMLKEMGLKNGDVIINDETLKHIIMTYTREGGVRKLKATLYNIVRELNLANLIKSELNSKAVVFPFKVEIEDLKILLKHKNEIDPDTINQDDKPGIVNGLWANSIGLGGVLPIQTIWYPSHNPMTLKATGHLEKVIKESTEVACSLAWNYLSDEIKNNYMTLWKTAPMGIHLHCPEGATPKDGPSAGAAITLAIYSLLTGKKIKHDIAMTGEINLEGKVTAIGGLEEKMEGAKRAGVKLVLFPRENIKHLEKIKQRNPNLLDDNFRAIPIETFDEVLKYSLV